MKANSLRAAAARPRSGKRRMARSILAIAGSESQSLVERESMPCSMQSTMCVTQSQTSEYSL